jgi:hypothetical protein
MVVGRNLRTAVTGDADAISTEAFGAMGKANFRGTPTANTNADDRNLPRRLGGTEVKLHVGDRVKLGSTHIGTITDVGTVLIQVKTSEGRFRVVCPWEVVRIPG